MQAAREEQEHPARSSGSPPGSVLIGIVSVQCGSALATTLFDDLGPGGAVFLRTAFAAIVLIAIWRPVAPALDGPTMRSIALFGLVLAGMNLCFFQALDRLPLGIAVTFEFTGPLAVALLGSRSRLDLLWATPRRARGSSSSRPTSATASTRSASPSPSPRRLLGALHPALGPGRPRPRRARRPVAGDGRSRRWS